WLDPSLPASLWEALPEYASRKGYQVLDLQAAGPIFDLSSLLAAFDRLLAAGAIFDHSLPSLRESLLELEPKAPLGFLVLFPTPDALRQNDEAGFEEFVEVLENVDEIRRREGRSGLKAIIKD
ncbi:MAG: hypothetical protein N2036_11090, partial [Bryobacteraceae bacterium]|nr:hypothetical protein [Bryobacteraceae bacterium]